MVYDWDAYEKLCYRLYIDEKKSLEDIMDHLKLHHKFTPSKRAFQTQFRRWDFPSKQNPAYKNDQLVARVKELWERNLSQREMLRILTEEDGYDIKQRELIRVRTRNRWLLRVPNGDKAKDPLDPPIRPRIQTENSYSSQSSSQTIQIGAGDMTPDAGSEHEALGKLAAGPGLAWGIKNDKKRRRRMKTWGGLPADPPGPPRFPSETTIDEAKVILSLDNDVYRGIRTTFARLCDEYGVAKKTLAGPDRWEAVKNQLVREVPQLERAMWQNKDAQEPKKLALDVICTDITKRMRTLEKRITVGEAKNVLGTNPEESRDLRSSFYQLLKEGGFSCKSDAGPEQWAELKRSWIGGSELIQRILAGGLADPAHDEKARALDVLARDVMKRLRDDATRRQQSRKKEVRQPPAKVAKTRPRQTPRKAVQAARSSGSSSVQMDVDYGHVSQVSHMDLVPTSTSSQVQMSLPVSMQSHTGMQQTPDALSQSAARILSSSLLGQSGMTLESQLGSSLLLAADAQAAAFVDQQYAQHFAAAQQVFHSVTPAPTSVAIFMRLHPSSTFVASTGLWIATLSSHSMQELRHAATEKFPGALCLRVEGVLKDGKGAEMPLQMDEDQELAAYLTHLQGVTPTFNVQLVPGWKTG